MPEPAANAELLRSLGRVVRGLSALFWGLPAALIIGFGTASAGWFPSFGVVPALATTGLLVYGLWLMRPFQQQERVWRLSLDRAQFLGTVTAGLSPFLYWWNKMPLQPFFTTVVAVLSVTSLVFLGQINFVLLRLGAMLPDETLRHETRQFTALNCALLCVALVLASAYWLAATPDSPLPEDVLLFLARLEHAGLWLLPLIVFLLLPLALTMALLWKTKEVILESIFGRRE